MSQSDEYSNPCESILYHGPGHQSKTHCEKTGKHIIHFTRYGSNQTPCLWKGDEAITGFFDEPPNRQEELELALKGETG